MWERNRQYRLVPDNTPPLFGTRGRLILDIAVSSNYIYRFIYFFSLFYSTGDPTERYKPGGIATKSNGLQLQKRQLSLFFSHCSIKGLSKK